MDTPQHAVERMTEIRIGELLGPPRRGERTDLKGNGDLYLADDKLSPNERAYFRAMAVYRTLIEPMLPASRRKLLKAIAEADGTKVAEQRKFIVTKGLRNADRLHKVLTAVGISKDEFEQVKAVKKKNKTKEASNYGAGSKRLDDLAEMRA